MSPKAFVCLFVLAALFIGSESALELSTVDPSEHPYILKVKGYGYIATGLIVSQKYVLAAMGGNGNIGGGSLTVTDQSGTVYPAIHFKAKLPNKYFGYVKICSLPEARFSMSEGNFLALIENDVNDAYFLYFNDDSPTLMKASNVTVKSDANCGSITLPVAGQVPIDSQRLNCVTASDGTNFCKPFFVGNLKPFNSPTLMIGKVFVGLYASRTCSGSGSLSTNFPYWFFHKLTNYRQEIIGFIPKVDIV